MALGFADQVLNGFGNTGVYQFATPSTTILPQNNSRLIRQIRGSSRGVDILGVDGWCLWSGTEPPPNIFGSMLVTCGIEILRTTVQFQTLPQNINFQNPGSGIQVVQYPAGMESLWFGVVSSVGAITPGISPAPQNGWNAAPPAANTFRFPPGCLRAYEDAQLWVVMYGGMNYPSGTNFPSVSQSVNHFRALSVIGVDYSRFDGSVSGQNQRSIPRSSVL